MYVVGLAAAAAVLYLVWMLDASGDLRGKKFVFGYIMCPLIALGGGVLATAYVADFFLRRRRRL